MLIGATLFIALFVTLNFLRYKAMFSFEWGDEAVHNQLAYRTFRHGLFTSNLKGDQIFDQHFRPAWLIMGTAYIPFPSILTWYFILLLSFAGTAWAFYYWSLRKSGDPWGAMLFSIAILCYPPLHQLAIGVYDPEKLVILFFTLVLLAFQKRNFLWFTVFVVAALCCKEIIAFTMIMFALMLALLRKPWKYWAFTVLVSICWLVAAYGFIIPGTMSVEYGSKYFPQLLGSDCESLSCLITHAISHPIQTMGILFSPVHLRILALLILPMAGLIFFCPMLMIPMAASIGMIFSVPGPLTVNQHHWFAPALPFIFAGSIIGAWRVAKFLAKDDQIKQKKVFRIIAAGTLITCLLFTIFGGFVGKYHDDPKDDQSYLNLKSVFDSRIYTSTDTDKTAWKLIRQIPQSATVTTNYGLMTPLATRETIKEFGRNAPIYDYFDFDYILIHLKDQYFGAGHDVRLNPNDLQRLIDEIEGGFVQSLYCDSNLFFGRKQKESSATNDSAVENAVFNIRKAKTLAASRLLDEGFMNIRD